MGERVLLVEDNPGDIRLIQTMLEEAKGNYSFESVTTLNEAITRIQVGDIDLILLDLTLPDSFGLETVKHICTAAPMLPIVVITGLEDQALAEKIAQEGAQDYLVKDELNSSLLGRIIHYAIEKKRSETLIQEYNRRFRSLVEQSRDGILMSDEYGMIVIWNRAQEELTGVLASEAVGRPVWEVQYQLAPSERRSLELMEKMKEKVIQFLQTGEDVWTDGSDGEELEMPDGTRRMLQSLVFGIEGPKGRQIASISRDITQMVENQNQISRQLRFLQGMRKIDAHIATSHDLVMTTDVILEQAQEQLRVDGVDILIVEDQTQLLKCFGARGIAAYDICKAQIHTKDGLPGEVIRRQGLVLVENLASRPPDPRRDAILNEGFVSYLGIPLRSRNRTLGVLEFFTRKALQPDAEWISYLEMLVGQAGIAVESINMLHDIQQSNINMLQAYETTIESWARTLNLRDEETQEHTRRVVDLAVNLARRMDFSDDEIIALRRGAYLHDIGKIAIPDSILHKPEPLTEEEWNQMRQHPKIAYDLLEPISFLNESLAVPFSHHEKWDGSGYPLGLRGEEIPKAARLFSVVDVWDALTSDRPYRKTWTEAEALDYIEKHAGTQFDPQVVDVFLALKKEEKKHEK